MFYVSTGIIIVKNKIKINTPMCLFIMCFGILCNLFTPPFWSSFGTPVYSVMFFMVIIKIQLKNNSVYGKLREASTIFYFFHLICWSIYTIVFLKEPNHLGIDSFIITLTGCLILSIVLILLKKHKNFTWIKKIL
jgi:hypothetical protein